MNMATRVAVPAVVRRPILLGLGIILLLGAIAVSGTSAVQSAVLLIAATLVSEDLTCIGAGQLVHRGEMSAVIAVIGCLLGIVIGDIGLWLAGRFMKPALEGRVEWRVKSIPKLILLARFVPGMRLPVYLAMGATGVDPIRFGLWALIGAIVWTPLLVLLVAYAGDAIAAPIESYIGSGWVSLLAAILICWIALHFITMLCTEIGRAKVVARISRLWRWEFWPSWIFYLPLLPWIGWLSLRYRGFKTITAANPGIPHGGFVGESKYQILRAIRSRHVVSTMLLSAGDFESQISNPEFPLVLKPDVGQRGAGVKIARSMDHVRRYRAENPGPVIVQPYHPGPYEAGIFYYRIPGEARGRIFSITKKRFPELIGDGRSTIEELIWQHPRFRMQAGRFLERHTSEAGRVLTAGERFRLAFAGNHCQGTLFCDGSDLITPELESAIDAVAQSFDGFYFGRFDVRYSDVQRFKAGEDIAVIELNGITSESTNLYDPTWSLWRAYRVLFKQWRLLFQIGAANRARGEQPSSYQKLLSDVITYYRNPRAPALAD